MATREAHRRPEEDDHVSAEAFAACPVPGCQVELRDMAAWRAHLQRDHEPTVAPSEDDPYLRFECSEHGTVWVRWPRSCIDLWIMGWTDILGCPKCLAERVLPGKPGE